MEKLSELSIPGNTSPALAQLAEHTSRYIEAGLSGAANTVKAYAGDWKRFGAWCAEHGLEPLPASVDTLAGFVTYLAETDKKVATIQRHCAAVAKAHVLRGLDSSTDDKKFKVLMEGIARVKGVRQKQAPAFSLTNFKRTVKSIDAKTLAGLRDRLILLLGFKGAFRQSELVAMNLEDLSFSEEGLIVNLAKSKTNQYSAAGEKAMFYSPDFKFCHTHTLQAWIQHLVYQVRAYTIQHGTLTWCSLKKLLVNSNSRQVYQQANQVRKKRAVIHLWHLGRLRGKLHVAADSSGRLIFTDKNTTTLPMRIGLTIVPICSSTTHNESF